MKRQMISNVLITVLLIAAAAVAQNAPAGTSDPNEIFNSMMQTMPEEMKNLIDSASTVKLPHHDGTAGNVTSGGSREVLSTGVQPQAPELDDLPPEIREQVRKTMRELENDSKGRMLQFKEMQNRKESK